MKKLGLLKAMSLCAKYPKLSGDERDKLRTERLNELIRSARENSEYYRQLYKDLPDSPKLEELPTVNKRDLMAHWDQWVTDKSVKLADVQRFMENLDNIGRKFAGKYLVFTTSGSTGYPLVMLCDAATNNVMAGISALRSYARREDLRAFMRRGGKTLGVFADSGFYLSNSSVRSRLLAMPWKKRQMVISSALLPVDEIVSQLNQFQPAMLGGYPSNLELLIDEQNSGRLNIHPVIIMTGGEHLSDELRERLSRAFNCYVQTSYACTEGGNLACECIHRHFHVNDDWLIVEPVDSNNRPVPDGVLSHKLLLTNLYNYTQPFIRYELTDRIIMHHQPCPCGNPSPWLELEGRNDDIITLSCDEGLVKVPPLAVYAKLKELPELRRFQLLVHPGNKIELRIEPAEGIQPRAAFEIAESCLRQQFSQYGVSQLSLCLSPDAPQQHPVSGKFKHIINLNQ